LRNTKLKSSGFTLLEVLIALTILAISSLAVINQTSQSLQQRQRLEQKTIALWVAENQLNALRVVKEWPSTGRRSNSITLLNVNWRVLTEISTTADPLLRKITVNVAIDDGDQERELASLTGFRGRH
jgi:general secretion pathway protein I